MKSTKIWANLGVSNVERTAEFYKAIGFTPNGKNYITEELTSFLVGIDNFAINFFLKDILQTSIKGELTDAQQSNEVIFTLSAETKAEVDDWAVIVRKAGANIISEPEEFGEGYYGFIFADPDGHKFNVFYM